MIQQLLREETIYLSKYEESVKDAISGALRELPFWMFQSVEREELISYAAYRSEKEISRIGHNAFSLFVPCSSIELPVVLVLVSPQGLILPSLCSRSTVLVLVLMPDHDDYSELKAKIYESIHERFKGRFLQERLKLCESREEAMPLIIGNKFPVGNIFSRDNQESVVNA